MLVSAKEMLDDAVKGHYAVGHFNINNFEWIKAILTAAQEMHSPVILGVSEGAAKYMTGFKTVVAMADAMVSDMGITVPVALHLDHGTYEGCLKCIDAGSHQSCLTVLHTLSRKMLRKLRNLSESALKRACPLKLK